MFHHSEIIAQLIRDNKIKPKDNIDGKIVYHDPCYLGRYNEKYDIPREIFAASSTAQLIESERNRQISFCCGAGGGRMWLEEKIGEHINNIRCDQLVYTGAGIFATGCPYCMIMLEDALKAKGLEDKIKVRDLAELVVSQ